MNQENESESQAMRGILNSITDSVLIIGKDFKVVFANEAALHLCGVSGDEVIGKSCHEISHRCPTPCSLPEKCPHQEVFFSGQPVTVKHMHYCHDGQARVFSIAASPILNADGHVVRMIEVIRDITEEERTAASLRAALLELEETGSALRKGESFMRNILESIDEGFIIIDPDYRIISANRAYCRQVKCLAENITGKHCYEVSHHLEKPCFWAGEECAPSRTFKTGAPSLAIHTHYDSDGKPLYIETRSYPIKDEAGAVTAVIETLNNITEVRKLEEQLRHAQKMEAIGTLAGGIAHDFNNLLSVIIGYGDVIQMRMKETETISPQLKEMVNAANRAAQLTRGLLAFSRKQLMELKAVKLCGIIADFKKMIERILGEDIELRLIPAAEDIAITADTGQIEQVLMNLVANARDAMSHGGILTIQTEVTGMDSHFIHVHGFGEPGRYATISVTDTGTGMDDATRQRIFEPYFTTKELGRGTGLGLSIAFGIVKQHKGFLECLSESGQGTTFRIYLPIASAADEKAEEKETPSSMRGTETILVAEDDPAVRLLMVQILNSFGYRVIDAVDGEDAVVKFRNHKEQIQLLLLDVIMPRKNGKDVYEDIKALKPDIRAIFVSGYARDLIKDRDVLDNGPEFLQKPVSTRDLLKKIREVLDR
ncbi:MAG: PAS domain-containing protein [Nitrospirae bacterium]|nr:PAS domain-containing protein [Nitrospirota bacterium]